MAIFNPPGYTVGTIVASTQRTLVALRNALTAVQNLHDWSSGIAVSDLTTLGFSAADAQTLQSAIADANAVAEIYLNGQPPSTYPQPASAYPYAASQRQVIGPQ